MFQALYAAPAKACKSTQSVAGFSCQAVICISFIEWSHSRATRQNILWNIGSLGYSYTHGYIETHGCSHTLGFMYSSMYMCIGSAVFGIAMRIARWLCLWL